MEAVPALVNCAVPSRWMSVQCGEEASQKFTAPVGTGVVPASNRCGEGYCRSFGYVVHVGAAGGNGKHCSRCSLRDGDGLDDCGGRRVGRIAGLGGGDGYRARSGEGQRRAGQSCRASDAVADGQAGTGRGVQRQWFRLSVSRVRRKLGEGNTLQQEHGEEL